MSKEKSLMESLAEIGQNDAEFRNEMDTLFIETLEEFLTAYGEGMQQASLEKLSFAIHKIKFAVEMYEIHDLYKEAEQGRQLVVDKAYTPEQLAASVEKVTGFCNEQIKKIRQRLG